MSQQQYEKEEWEFHDEQERDHFIDERFPERQMDEVPGGYNLPHGAYLGVIGLTVTFYPKLDEPPAAGPHPGCAEFADDRTL